MEGFFRHISVNKISVLGYDLIDPVTRKISDRWLPQITSNQTTSNQTKHRSMYGTYSRKDITVGRIVLEIAEDGLLIQLIKDNNVFSQKQNGDISVGNRHEIEPGLYYILTHTDNAILEIDTSIHNLWEKTKMGSKIKKYILVKRLFP
jgi:hypothetical protein